MWFSDIPLVYTQIHLWETRRQTKQNAPSWTKTHQSPKYKDTGTEFNIHQPCQHLHYEPDPLAITVPIFTQPPTSSQQSPSWNLPEIRSSDLLQVKAAHSTLYWHTPLSFNMHLCCHGYWVPALPLPTLVVTGKLFNVLPLKFSFP